MDVRILDLFYSRDTLPSRAELVGVMWHLWKAQNASIFQQRNPEPCSIIDAALAMNKKFLRWNSENAKEENRSVNRPGTWTPHHKGMLKFNIDGSLLERSSDSAIAGVCRDSNGNIVAGFAKSVRRELICGKELICGLPLRLIAYRFCNMLPELIKAHGILWGLIEDCQRQLARLKFILLTHLPQRS